MYNYVHVTHCLVGFVHIVWRAAEESPPDCGSDETMFPHRTGAQEMPWAAHELKSPGNNRKILAKPLSCYAPPQRVPEQLLITDKIQHLVAPCPS